jgi:hypothetical protein
MALRAKDRHPSGVERSYGDWYTPESTYGPDAATGQERPDQRWPLKR